MKAKNRTGLKNVLQVNQKLSYRGYAFIFSLAILANCFIIFFLNLSNPRLALAADCVSTYTLDWGDPTTYTVTCGSVNAGNWTVKGDTCFYYSPVFNVGGNPGDPARTVELAVRINQSGNLTANDFAWVYVHVNGALYSTNTARGDTGAAVFSVDLSFSVPASGTYRVSAKLKSDKSNEFWQIKNGDVTACVIAPITPLPVTLTAFSGGMTAQGARLQWTTAAEVNNDYFTLSRSVDAKEYMEIARIKGQGTTSTRHDYDYTDDHIATGISYYRLSQTDYDGSTEIYNVVALNSYLQSETNQQAGIFPNPYKENFHVVFVSEFNQPVIVSIHSLNGALLDHKEFMAKAGSNLIDYNSEKSLPPGAYLVSIKPENGARQFIKVIQQ